jgi:hypothetical protein
MKRTAIARGQSELTRTPMPPRTSPMPRASSRAQRAVAATRAPHRDTGFSAATQLDLRTRAGNGDPEEACCEACGIWLGLHGGQCQHLVPRFMGGRGPKAPWWINHLVNGALLCGTVYTGDHALAESRSGYMRDLGFWLVAKSDPLWNPSLESFRLYGRTQGGLLGGTEVWRTISGGYSFEQPERVSAA